MNARLRQNKDYVKVRASDVMDDFRGKKQVRVRLISRNTKLYLFNVSRAAAHLWILKHFAFIPQYLCTV